ncbi:hypothetical protein CJF42_14225 [Pseudoalteromonas sp. NBT06-2]|uniref:DsrH/TusB family sulfur metabolism protein n=1 Tax=Pseudoalteromonas sp. NBT06-2 TaxID=2025950 RepID=UPI000BA6BA8C|nr:DsrH/TusB family sulfur metabolism protein [Pseudoalteromonas sp. NBT06-2]PAJ73720.1 hypothetical protein CJF42_14225 [Pseudoalteromonas sp. NBT06-2]
MNNQVINNATLHILSKPITKTEYKKLRDIKNDSDCVLFTRDACYSLLAPHIDISSVIALDIDCEARGIKNEVINLIDYKQWVDLALQYKNILSW